MNKNKRKIVTIELEMEPESWQTNEDLVDQIEQALDDNVEGLVCFIIEVEDNEHFEIH